MGSFPTMERVGGERVRGPFLTTLVHYFTRFLDRYSIVCVIIAAQPGGWAATGDGENAHLAVVVGHRLGPFGRFNTLLSSHAKARVEEGVYRGVSRGYHHQCGHRSPPHSCVLLLIYIIVTRGRRELNFG